MRLDAGSVIAQMVKVRAMTWPKGAALPGLLGELNVVTLSGKVALPVGALIPNGTDVKLLPGVDAIELRPESGGQPGQAVGHRAHAGRR